MPEAQYSVEKLRFSADVVKNRPM